MKKFIFGLSLICFSFSSFALEDCLVVKTSPCKTTLEKLHPTQFALGRISIPDKIEKLEKKYKKGKLDKYLKKKAIPAILGPDMLFYIQDGHHTMAALDLSKKIPQEEKKTIISELIDKSELSAYDFKKYMIDNQKVFLLNKDYKLQTFEEIPANFKAMQDNPYRSFAELVQNAQGFCKAKFNYLEFLWGKYFEEELLKEGIVLTESNDSLYSLVDKGVEMATRERAKTLPGFKANALENCPE